MEFENCAEEFKVHFCNIKNKELDLELSRSTDARVHSHVDFYKVLSSQCPLSHPLITLSACLKMITTRNIKCGSFKASKTQWLKRNIGSSLYLYKPAV